MCCVWDPEFASIRSDMVEPLLTPIQAAKLLQVNPKTVKKLAIAGRLPGLKIGRLWRFRESALESWIDSELDSSSRPRPREGESKSKSS